LAKTDLASELLLEAERFTEVLAVVVAYAELLVDEIVESSIICQLQIVNSLIWYMVSHLKIFNKINGLPTINTYYPAQGTVRVYY